MKTINHLRFVFQKLAVRLFVGRRTKADRQRGASALEYIVLAAAIVIVVGIGAATLSPEISGTFEEILSSIKPEPDGGE